MDSDFSMSEFMEMADDDMEYFLDLEEEYFDALTELCNAIENADRNPQFFETNE